MRAVQSEPLSAAKFPVTGTFTEILALPGRRISPLPSQIPSENAFSDPGPSSKQPPTDQGLFLAYQGLLFPGHSFPKAVEEGHEPNDINDYCAQP